MRSPFKDVAFVVPLALLGAGAVALYMTVTRWGIGLSPDSAVYIAGARGLLQGRGYSFPRGGGAWDAITLWPPFYSMVLAALGRMGLEPMESARWLNGILLGGTTILIGLLLREALGGSRLVPFMGALLFLIDDDALSAFGWAWSDGLALFLGFAGVLLTGRSLATGQRNPYWISAGLIGLSVLSRYAGVAFLVTALIMIALESSRGDAVGKKVGKLIAFGAASCVWMGVWLFRNALVSGDPIGPRVFPGPITTREWEAVYSTVSLWFVPGRLSSSLRTWSMVLVASTLLVLSLTAIVARPQGRRERGEGNPWVGRMVLLFIPVYILVILGTRTSLRYFNLTEVRYYTPLYAALVIVCLVAGQWVYDRVKVALAASGSAVIRRWGQIILGVGAGTALGLMLAFHGVQAWKWARESYSEGLGYANESWHRSELVRYVRSLPADAAVFSNGYDALYVLTGREVYAVPQATPSLDRGPSSQEDWDDMAALLQDRSAVVVFFREPTRRGLVNEETLRGKVPLCPLLRAVEGTIYAWCGDSGGETMGTRMRGGHGRDPWPVPFATDTGIRSNRC